MSETGRHVSRAKRVFKPSRSPRAAENSYLQTVKD
jgi:hypothetical protein